VSGESAIINPKTAMDWKSEELPKLPKQSTTYTANSNSWITSATFEEFLVQLVHQMEANTKKILLFIDQYVAHPRDTTVLKNIRVMLFPPNCTSHLQPVDMGIIHAFQCQYKRHLKWRTVAMIDGELFGDAGLPDL
jgi:hypothetical protein